MTTTATIYPPKSKRRSAKPVAIVGKPLASHQRPAPAGNTTPETASLDRPRVTKQELVLTLLSRPNGASIEDLMQATEWQQHSVRGFLAGTVKKKLGFTLTSTKAKGDVRRYRVESKRGR